MILPGSLSSVIAGITGLGLALLPSAASPPDLLLDTLAVPSLPFQPPAGQGAAVTMDGDLVAVGAPEDNWGGPDSGSVYVFDLRTGGLLHQIRNPRAPRDVGFGKALALSGTRLVVGGVREARDAPDGVPVFLYDLAGGTPDQPALTLNNPDPQALDAFGVSVAMDGNLLVVGAKGDDTDGQDTGSVYCYDLSTRTPDAPFTRLSVPDCVGCQFGWSVSVSGARVLVGAPTDNRQLRAAGSAYLFQLAATGRNFREPIAVWPNPEAAAFDLFGMATALHGRWAVVGAPDDRRRAGGVFVYDLQRVPAESPKFIIPNPSPQTDDAFGTSVAVEGNLLVVGAPNDDTRPQVLNTGRVQVFDLAGTPPLTPIATLAHPFEVADDRLGMSVATDDGRVAVGVPGQDQLGSGAGACLVFGQVPKLSISPTPESGLKLTWPSGYRSFSLQSSRRLGSADWTGVAMDTPGVVVLPPPDSDLVFRLNLP